MVEELDSLSFVMGEGGYGTPLTSYYFIFSDQNGGNVVTLPHNPDDGKEIYVTSDSLLNWTLATDYGYIENVPGGQTTNVTMGASGLGAITLVFVSQNNNWYAKSYTVASSPTGSTSLIQTNFITDQLYTNSYGRMIQVSADAALTSASVAGMAQLSLEVPGQRTNRASVLTAIGVVTGVSTNAITPCVVTNLGTYKFHNTSSGGDSAVVSGGQILILAN